MKNFTSITHSNVSNQLASMRSSLYDIGILNRPNSTMNNYVDLNPLKISKMIQFLKYQNLNGRDIFLRPARTIDRALILVDDLDISSIKSMRKEGSGPACTLLTSPNNYQVWVDLGPQPMQAAERKLVAGYLAETFKGDPGSVDAVHYGRLAGYTNRKPCHLKNDGTFPFVICCHDVKSGIAKNAEQIRKWASKQNESKNKVDNNHDLKSKKDFLKLSLPDNSKSKDTSQIKNDFSFYWKWWFDKQLYPQIDYSKGDFAVACMLLRQGYSISSIELAMSECSPEIDKRKGNHKLDYVQRTVRNAYLCLINS
ncbi:MAG: RepB family DNA primase [Lactobacillales bacterium]|nr:RepB family DNA primase [Lactobacillales bacterium]